MADAPCYVLGPVAASLRLCRQSTQTGKTGIFAAADPATGHDLGEAVRAHSRAADTPTREGFTEAVISPPYTPKSLFRRPESSLKTQNTGLAIRSYRFYKIHFSIHKVVYILSIQ